MDERGWGIVGAVVGAVMAFFYGLDDLSQLVVVLMVLQFATKILAVIASPQPDRVLWKPDAARAGLRLLMLGLAAYLDARVTAGGLIQPAVAGFLVAEQLAFILDNFRLAGVRVPTALENVGRALSSSNGAARTPPPSESRRKVTSRD